MLFRSASFENLHQGALVATLDVLDELGLACDWPEGDARPRQTYGTIALLRAELFAAPWCDIPPGNPEGWRVPLVLLLRRAMAAGQVGASPYTGRWTDVGTPERLERLNARG